MAELEAAVVSGEALWDTEEGAGSLALSGAGAKGWLGGDGVGRDWRSSGELSLGSSWRDARSSGRALRSFTVTSTTHESMYQLSGPASPGSLDFKIPSSGGRRPSTLARSGAAACDAATRRLQGLSGVVGHSVGLRGSRAAGKLSIGIRCKLCSDDAQLPLASNIIRHEQMHAGDGATSVLLPSACSAMTYDGEDQALTNGSHSRRRNQDLESIAGLAQERGVTARCVEQWVVWLGWRCGVRGSQRRSLAFALRLASSENMYRWVHDGDTAVQYTAGGQVSTPSWGSTSATGRTHHLPTTRSPKIKVHRCQRLGTTAFSPGASSSLCSRARREDSSLPGRYVSPDEYPSLAEHGHDRFAEQGGTNTSSGRTESVAAVPSSSAKYFEERSSHDRWERGAK